MVHIGDKYFSLDLLYIFHYAPFYAIFSLSL